jgi:hypothetical protein
MRVEPWRGDKIGRMPRLGALKRHGKIIYRVAKSVRKRIMMNR